MKRIIIVLLSILLFTGCTQSPEIEVPTDRTLTSASAP